jgi:hypothetical protein
MGRARQVFGSRLLISRYYSEFQLLSWLFFFHLLAAFVLIAAIVIYTE